MNSVVEMNPEPKRGRAVAVTPSPMDIVNAAMKGGNVEMYREAVALMKEMDTFAARKAFNNALADAKAKLPILKKNRLVSFENKAGDTTRYRHEDLAEVVRTVVPILSEFGLSHRYRLSNKPGQPISVTCIISHRDGYCEENELSAAADPSGGKNAIQAVKSTVTYLERITLIASLGLAAAEDDDGRTSEAPAEAEPEAAYTPPAGSITQDQADQLRDALLEKGASSKAFLQWVRTTNPTVDRIEAIPAVLFGACVDAIGKFRKAGQ